MKKFFYFAVMALFLAGMTACEKDEPENGGNGGNGGNTGNGPLVGTEWVYSESDTEVDEGVTYTVEMEMNVRFTTNAAGSVFSHFVMSAEGTEYLNEEDTTPFTYTYEGTATQGSGVLVTVDEETNQPDETQFVIRGNEMSISYIDEDTNEPVEIVLVRR